MCATGIAPLIDLDVLPRIVAHMAVEDNKGFVHPDFTLTAAQEPAFTRRLADVYGRAREHVDAAAQVLQAADL